MTSPYKKTYFTRNRRALREHVDSNLPIVLTANTQLQYSGDTAYPFRQDTNFWYVTGIDIPDVVYAHDGTKEVLILPKPNAIRDVFDGSVSNDELRKVSGIDRILTYKQGATMLKQLVSKNKQIATLLPATGLQTHYGVSPNPARKMIVNRLRRMQAGLTFTHLGLPFAQQRMLKSTEEIAAIQASIDLTVLGFKKVKRAIMSGIFEYELEAKFTNIFGLEHARHAYPPIIAGGARACVLHYDTNNKQLGKSNLVLMDVGAEKYRGAADITRTYAVSPPTKRQIAILQAVVEIQDYAFSLLKPGVIMREYEKLVEQEMGRALKKLGIIKHASRKQIRKFFPHATSHFLGLDVHDSADYSLPLESGMVLTVEPGIYIPEESVGVRIEDNVVITSDGIKIMSKALPRDLW